MQDRDGQGASDSFQTPRGPACLIFGDDPARRSLLAELVTALDGRVAASGLLADALAAIGGQPGTAVAVLDVMSDGGAELDRLLNGLDDAVARAHVQAMVVFEPALLDIVSARVELSRVQLVVGLDQPAIRAALQALLDRRPGVAEPGPEENARRLAALSVEAARISRALANLSEDADAPATTLPQDGDAALAVVRALIRLRRLREQFFDRTLFADPAWDMLLDLLAARLERRRVAVSSLCIAAAVPPTTALRWIGAMTEQGLLLRQADPDDGRRAFIALSEQAADAMASYAAAAGRVLATVRS